jgi:hypothetical protein
LGRYYETCKAEQDRLLDLRDLAAHCVDLLPADRADSRG